MIMHRLSLIALLCILIASCVQVEGQQYYLDARCSSESGYLFCGIGCEITFTIENAKFDTVSGNTLSVHSNPSIYISVTKSTETEIKGKIMTNEKEGTVPEGPYVLNIPSADPNSNMFETTLNIGRFYDQKNIIPQVGGPPDDAYVSNQSTSVIWSYIPFNITGLFNTSKTYQVWFYAVEMQTGNWVPECGSVTVVDNTTLTCELKEVLPYSDYHSHFSFLVEEGQFSNIFLTVKNFLQLINTIEDPTSTKTTTTTTQKPVPIPSDYPVITSASGDCVSNSSNCKDGETLTLNGDPFVGDAAMSHKVNIEGVDKAQCVVKNTTTNSLSCEFAGTNGTEGVYVMTIQLLQKNGNWTDGKAVAGSLVLGKNDGSSGWTVDYLKPTPNNNVVPAAPKAQSATVTTALTIVFAILFAITIVAILVICIRYKLISRKTWTTIKKELEETQVEEMRPKAAVQMKGEKTNVNT